MEINDKKMLIGLKSCTKTKISFPLRTQKHELEKGHRLPIREAREVGRAKQKGKKEIKLTKLRWKKEKLACYWRNRVCF